MKHTSLRQGLNALNLFLVATFLVLALYSAIGQQTLPYIGQYRPNIESFLSEEFGADVSIRQLDGDMDVLTPSVHMEGIVISPPGEPDDPVLSIAAVDAVLDPRASLLNFTPVFKSIRLSGVSVLIDTTEKNTDPSTSDPASIEGVIEGLLLQQNVELVNATIELKHANGRKILQLDHLAMTGDGFHRLMTGSVSYGDENKIKAGIRLYSHGSPYDLEDFYLRGVLDLPQLDVEYWLDELVDVSVFETFLASAQLSVEFDQGLLNYAKLNLASPSVHIHNQTQFNAVSTELWLKQSQADQWNLWLSDGRFTVSEETWQFSDLGLKLSRNMQGNRWQAYADSLVVEDLIRLSQQLNLMPKSASSLVQQLNPSGILNRANLVIQERAEGEPTVTLAAEFEQANVDAYQGAPSVRNLSGVIAANPDQGRVQFDGDNVYFDFPTVYDEGFLFTYGRGQVDWFLSDLGVRIVGNGLSLGNAAIESISGGFVVDLPHHKLLEPSLELNLSVENVQVTEHRNLVPKNTSASLKTWLNESIQSGLAKEGQFYLYLPLTETANPLQLELYLKPKDVALAYLSDWPEIEGIGGELWITPDQVIANVATAQTLGGKVAKGQVRFMSEGDGHLWVHAPVVGEAADGFSYFSKTPLKSVGGGVLADWRMSGQHETEVGLHIPFAQGGAIEADVRTHLSKASLDLSNQGLTLNHVTGSLRYSSRTGLTSPGLDLHFWDKPFKATMTSNVLDDDLITDIRFSGGASMSGLKQWAQLDLLKPLSGNTPITGHFYIDTRDSGFTGLKIESDLNGVGVDLPQPFTLKPEDTRKLAVQLEILERPILSIQYGDLVSSAIQLGDGGLSAGQIYLGKTEAYVPSKPGLLIEGHVSQVNVEEWLGVWEGLQSNQPQESTTPNPISRIRVGTDRIVWDEQTFDFVNVDIQHDIRPTGSQWKMSVDAPIAKGQLQFEQGTPVIANLDYIHWPEPDNHGNDEGGQDSDVLKNVYPHTFPALKLKVAEIFVGPTNYGRWSIDVEPHEKGAWFKNIDGEIKKLNVVGQLHWYKSDTFQQTQANLQLSSNDVGGIQKAWRIKPAIESNKAKATVNLNWLSSPADIQIAMLNGDVSLNMRDGRLIEAGDASALGAFGLFNFGSIGRRLRLDFSDVYQSGVHFDSLKGKANIENGVIKIINTFNVDGPAAKFAMSGQIDAVNETLNQELSVTFPISSTLPFVAILAGFAPPVAASLFVGERLVGDEIEKYTSATYKLTGPFKEPNLKLMKRFDNDIEGKKDKSFWHRMKDFFGVGDD